VGEGGFGMARQPTRTTLTLAIQPHTTLTLGARKP